MNAFATPEWESNPVADKTCNQLFKGRQFQINEKNKNKKGNKDRKLKVKTRRVKTKEKQRELKRNIKNIKSAEGFKRIHSKKVADKHQSELFTSNFKNKKEQMTRSHELTVQNVKPIKNKAAKEEEENKIKKHKPKITHQTLFSQTSRKLRLKSNVQGLLEPKHLKLKERISSKKKLKRLKKKLYKTNQNILETQQRGEKDQNSLQAKEKQIWNKQKTKEKAADNQIAWELSTKSEVTKETRKSKETQNYKEKLKNVLQQNQHVSPALSKKQKAALPLHERMLEKLKAARFRYLNEQMYTSAGKEAKKYFESDQDVYQAYHEGFKQQVARWPLNPLDVIIQKIKKLPRTHVIADFGCGEAKLAKSVPQMVHSFDLVAVDESVTACDMAHVPLENNSVDVVVFCLSLMGTNLKDYLLESHRVLKVGGLLKIAEVESRFDNVDDFIKNVQGFGFAKTRKDLSHDLFCLLDFVKKESNIKRKKLPDISLNPCLYKKR